MLVDKFRQGALFCVTTTVTVVFGTPRGNVTAGTFWAGGFIITPKLSTALKAYVMLGPVGRTHVPEGVALKPNW